MAEVYSDRSVKLSPNRGQTGVRPVAETHRLSIVVVAFLFALIVPLIFSVGPLRLQAYRVVLLVMFIPSFLIWLRGGSRAIRAVDLMVVLMVLWMSLANLYHFGLGQSVDAIGILTLEHFGAYLLGRVFIRTPEDFRKLAKVLFVLAVILLAFGLYEALTGHNLYRALWDRLGRVPPDVFKERRLGLDRVQGPFDHPILTGVFATPVVGMAVYVIAYKRGFVSTTMLAIVAVASGFLSVSSGPLSALIVQVGLALWDAIFRRYRRRWWAFFWLMVAAYIAIDLLSNRTPIVVAISYLALNVQTGLARVYIWYWGWVNILEHPVFGVGPGGDWQRYAFMTQSFDMFWLLYAMSYGLFCGIMQVFAPLVLATKLVRRKITDPWLHACRMGWLLGFGGIFMAGWMVHFWNAPLALYFFFLGAGMWLLDVDVNAQDDAEPDDTAGSGGLASPYTRFSQEHTRQA